MPDCASKAKASAAQHEGRVVICAVPANPLRGNTSNSLQTIAPVTEKITDVAVVDAKYDKYFDDTNYYSA